MSQKEITYTGRYPDRLQSHVETETFVSNLQHFERRQGTASWAVYNTPLQDDRRSIRYSFDGFFKGTIPGKESLRTYVERSLEDRAGAAIGIEFGGMGSALFAGFTEGFFARSLGVTLTDTSRGSNIHSPKGHGMLFGDLRDEATQGSVDQWLQSQKADLIVERMVGALNHVPKDPYYIARFISRWYSLLSDRGLMFVEIPRFMDVLARPWMDHVTQETGGTIDLSFKRGKPLNSRFRIQKFPGAPDELPLLNPWRVKSTYSAQKRIRAQEDNASVLARALTLLKSFGIGVLRSRDLR